ncbi:MAG: insulinase family protein [Clostridia bacterium]|nr:insulinase family protein [Clostridia bacterium]
MQSKTDKLTGETCYETTHSSGLKIRIVKKPGKSRKTAMLAANFGSINREFEYNGEFVTIPNGTAHFLEHKLFEGVNGNAFDFYAKTGAKANAFTSNDKTAYYFICTDKFEENLSILLSFISNPYLTDENVEKEKGIIGQEIKMYEDEPSWQGYFGLIGCLYKDHPVKYDIAGTVEDIAPITVDTLMSCYNTYYDPSNMVLAVAGDVDIDEVLKLCDKHIKPTQGKTVNQIIAKEKPGVVKEYSEKIMPVSRPLFYIGIKDNDTELSGFDLAKKEVEIQMLCEMLFGTSTQFYKDLYDRGIINEEFESEYEMSDTFAFCFFGGESDEPEKVLDSIKTTVSEFLEKGIDEQRFLQVRNALYGSLIMSCDNVSKIVNSLVSSEFSKREPFDKASAIKEITPYDIMARAKKLFDPLDIAMSVIKGE